MRLLLETQKSVGDHWITIHPHGKGAGKVSDIEELLGEGSAGSASQNVAATAKAWNKKDMLEMLGSLPKGKEVKKSMRSQKEWHEVAARKKEEYGADETYADPEHDSYPLTKGGVPNRKRVIAAWDYIHTRKNGKEYSSSQRSRIEKRIRLYAKKHFHISLESEETKKSFLLSIR